MFSVLFLSYVQCQFYTPSIEMKNMEWQKLTEEFSKELVKMKAVPELAFSHTKLETLNFKF